MPRENFAYSPTLQVIDLAYNQRAAFKVRTLPLRRSQALRAARIIGEYNEFSPVKIALFLRLLPRRFRVEMGREYSPVMYLSVQGWIQPADVRDIEHAAELADIAPDETDNLMNEYRLWWD